jgi:hypothetical protein
MAAGTFTPSALLNIQLKAESMWSDAAAFGDFQAESEAAQALLRNQTARLADLQDPEKDRTVTVTWVKSCDIVDEACETNCTIDGPEIESVNKEYALDMCRKVDFSVNAEKMRTNTYSVEDLAARGMATALRELDEWWSKQAILKLKTFQGVNVSPSPHTWDNANARTSVAAVSYNRTLVPYLLKVAIMNKMRNNFILSNDELYLDWLNAEFDAGNLDGRGAKARIDALNMTFDLYSFAAAGVAEDLYMVNKNAVAMVTKTRNPTAPVDFGGSVGQTRYTVASPTLPGVSYDVYYTLSCVTNSSKANIVHAWRVETNGGIFLNPEMCPVTIDVGGTPTALSPTGVLAFAKV